MSENRSGRQPDNAAPGSAKALSDSPLRPSGADDASIFADEAPSTDEAPTIISKNPPAQPVTATAIKPATPETLLSSLRGRKLAHFELIEPIGVGGMAAVLRARDTQLDRSVALKILPPDVAHDEDNIQRFRQEARAAARLDHENIARVFYCGEDQRLHFIAFEFVEGENLRTILERRRRLPVPEAVRYVLQIASGLEHAATRGVVHRDVKPSNIIITPTGRAKLVDMGLARSLAPQTNPLTQSGMTLGTFDYISPEQALEPREADARSDIYSLGCTFYHMLTGQPPVPEGTAAKKMHYHQHVAPLDPRQLNPEIPDEVALVLSRMMAKNPKDRYQRPVELVQHLMQIANKVGAAAGIPEGVLFVDAPLLVPPRKRPLLLISAGALALATLLMVLSLVQTTQRPSGKAAHGVKDELKVVKDSVSAAAKAPTAGSPPAMPKGVMEIRKEEDLAALLKDESPRLVGYVVQDFEITDANLVFQGAGSRSLTLKPKADDEGEGSARRPIITWKWQPRETGEPAAALTIDGGDAVFTDLRFRIDGSAGTPDQSAGAIAVRGKGTVLFEKCSFEQVNVAALQFTKNRKDIPLASVLALPGGNGRPRLDLEDCTFSYGATTAGLTVESGQAAIGLHGPAEVYAKNCSFMAHAAQFHQRGEGQSKITLVHCSGFVVTGPVFRLDDQASCLLKIDYSIWSSPESVVSGHDPLHLIHQTDAKEPKVTFAEWKRNCYDHLNAMWVRPAPTGGETYITTYEEFKREITNFGGKDSNSTTVPDTVSIWANDKPHRQKPRPAFQLSKTAREVRQLDGIGVLGIERGFWGDMQKLPPLPDEPRVADLKEFEKVVDPSLPMGVKMPAGVYREVFQAINAAQPGDVIRIKHGKDRRLNVEALKKRDVKVTLRPYDENYHPILTLADTSDQKAYFFRLHDGEMVFENLEIELEPDQPGFLSQTLALMDSNASCAFRNCIITLKQNADKNGNRPIPLSVVTLSEDSEAMMMMGAKPARPAPEVIFENCFIRGEGEVVTNLGGRPLDLRMDNTLVGLTGSFMTVQAGVKDAGADTVKLNIQRSSVFTTEPMLLLKQGKNRNPKGLPPVRVDRAGNCLFAALEDKPLVVMDLPDTSAATLRNYFDWKGTSDNFSGFDRLLEDASGFQLDQNGWQETFYKGAPVHYVRVTIPLAAGPRKLWEVGANDFRPKSESLQRHGAAFDNEQSQLPPIERK